jgi:hypothetical protein
MDSRAPGLELRPVLIPPSTCPPSALSVCAFVGGPPVLVGRVAVAIPDPLISRAHANICAQERANGEIYMNLTCTSRNRMQIIYSVGGTKAIIGQGQSAELKAGDKVLLYFPGHCEFIVSDVEFVDGNRGSAPKVPSLCKAPTATPLPILASNLQLPIPERKMTIAPLKAPSQYSSSNVSSCFFPVAPTPASGEIVPAAVDVCYAALILREVPKSPEKVIVSSVHSNPPELFQSHNLETKGMLFSADLSLAVSRAEDTESRLPRSNTVWGRKLACVQSAVKERRKRAECNGRALTESQYFKHTDESESDESLVAELWEPLAKSAPKSEEHTALTPAPVAPAIIIDLTISPPAATKFPLNSSSTTGSAVQTRVCNKLASPEGEFGDSNPVLLHAISSRATSTPPDHTDLCPVCREVLQMRGHLGLLPCRHVFCLDCILAWSRITNHCCLCKREFSEIVELGRSVAVDSQSRKEVPRAALCVIPTNFEGFKFANVHTVASRRQAMVNNHVDDDAALAWRIAMEEGYAAADGDGEDLHVYSSSSAEDGWIDPRAHRSNQSMRRRAPGRQNRRDERRMEERSSRQRNAYFVDGSSQSTNDEGSASSIEIVLPEASDGRDYHCIGCSEDGNEDLLMLCDGCDTPQHTFCCIPKLAEVPSGLWLCDQCNSRHVRECPSLPRPMFVLQLQAEASAIKAQRLNAALSADMRHDDSAANSEGARSRQDRSHGLRTDLDRSEVRPVVRKEPRQQMGRGTHMSNRRPFTHPAVYRGPRAAESRISRPITMASSHPVTDLLQSAINASRAQRSQILPRGDMAHRHDASESAHMLVPLRHLRAEDANAARRSPATLETAGIYCTSLADPGISSDDGDVGSGNKRNLSRNYKKPSSPPHKHRKRLRKKDAGTRPSVHALISGSDQSFGLGED